MVRWLERYTEEGKKRERERGGGNLGIIKDRDRNSDRRTQRKKSDEPDNATHATTSKKNKSIAHVDK